METALLDRPTQEQYTSAEVERLVLGWANELSDKSSELHQQFYGALALKSTPLQQSNRPMAGNLNLWKDETSHRMTLDGQEYESASFKIRGALLAALLMYRENPEIERFVTASHGNHGIGVAMAAKYLGIEAVVYCPESVNETKIAKLTALDATIVKDRYANFEAALAGAEDAAGYPESAIIYPYDQPEVMAGQATVLLETLADLELLQARGLFDMRTTPITCTVGVAGGGLISGCAIVAKEARKSGRIGNNFRLVGAQMEDCDAARRAVDDLKNGGVGVARFEAGLNEACDSTAVIAPGNLTLPFLSDPALVQDFVVLSEAEVGNAMRTLTGIAGKMIEPAGALAYAANQKLAAQSSEKGVYVSVVCGANVTQATYNYFMDKSLQAYNANLRQIGELAALSYGKVRPKSPGEGNMYSGVTDSLARYAIAN